MLMKLSGHTSVRSLAKYARISERWSRTPEFTSHPYLAACFWLGER